MDSSIRKKKSRGSPLITYKGSFPLESPRNAPGRDILYESHLALLGDTPLTTIVKSHEMLSRWRRVLERHTYGYVASQLDKLANAIMNDRRDLNALRQCVESRFWHNLPVHDELYFWSQTGDAGTFKYLLSWFSYFKKLDYFNPDLEKKALADWLRTDSDLSDPAWIMSSRVSRLRQIFGLLTSKFSRLPVDLDYKFGPGGIADGNARDLYRKSQFPRYWAPYVEARLRYLNEDDAYDFLHHYGKACHHVGAAQKSRVTQFTDSSGVRTHSKFRYAAKSYKALRAIVCEPNSVMFTQQGVMSYLYDQIDGHLRRFIDLDDQTVNQEAAREGSKTGKLVTIDLTAASDTVSEELAKATFGDTELGEVMLSLRSLGIELPDGSRYDMKKFSPMGNALCFPVQCLIFLSVVFLTYEEVGDSTQNHLSGSDNVLYSSPLVYGDDIICDSRVYDHLMEVLRFFGFIPNPEKSFDSSVPFKESCGGFYYNGYSVTPILPKFKTARKPAKGITSTLDLEGVVAVHNRLAIAGYHKASSVVLQHIRRYLGHGHTRRDKRYALAFSRTPNGGLTLQCFTKPFSNVEVGSDVHLGLVRQTAGRTPKWPELRPFAGGWYQYMMVRAVAVVSVTQIVSLDDPNLNLYLYYLWWNSASKPCALNTRFHPQLDWSWAKDLPPESIPLKPGKILATKLKTVLQPSLPSKI